MNLFRRLHDPSLPYVRLSFRQEVLHVAVAIMEAMWMAPWFVVILAGARALSPYSLILYVIGNVLMALWIVRLLDAWGMFEGLRQVVFLSALVMVILGAVGVVFPPPPEMAAAPPGSERADPAPITVPPALPILILLSIVWWRGLRLAIVPPTPTRVAFGMRLGILFFFGVALLPDAQAVTLVALPPFFFFGLLAVSLARATSLRESGGQATLFGARWGFFMAGATFAVTVVGFGAAAMLAGVGPEAFAQVIQPILAVVIVVFTILMIPVLLIAQAIIEALFSALGDIQFMGNLLQTPEIGFEQGDPQPVNRLAELMEGLRQFIDQIGGVQTCITALVVLVVVGVILLTLRRHQRAALAPDEEREDLEGDVLGGLRQMVRRGWQALNSALNAVAQCGLGRNLFAALTIRRIYAQMARRAGEEGYPRAASQTPYEYQHLLQETFPAAGAEIGLITEAYVRVHYGEVPESEAALQQVVAAWNTLKARSAW